jgi:hypothetical protein
VHGAAFVTIGPEPTLTTISSAAVQLPQSGHWMQAAAFCGLIREPPVENKLIIPFRGIFSLAKKYHKQEARARLGPPTATAAKFLH